MDTAYRLNTRLIKNLSKVLFMPAPEIIATTGINYSTWYRIVESPQLLTVQQLIVVADSLHIPVRRFFSKGKTDIIGRRDDYITEDYQPCRYDTAELQRILDSRPDLSWQMAADANHITRDNFRLSMLAVTHTPVVRFMKACEVWGIDPFMVLIDPNPEPVPEEKNNKRKDYQNLRTEIGELRGDIRRLSDTIDDLTRKYEALLKAHDALAHRVSVNIENVSYSHIGIAADPLSPQDRRSPQDPDK